MNDDLMFSSDKLDWQTPDEILDLVRKVGPIKLDPATVRENPCGAEVCYFPTASIPQPPKEVRGKMKEQPPRLIFDLNDGLRDTWKRGGLVYCNPPYGREIVKWMAKARQEAKLGAEIIMLVPSRTDTAWWHVNVVGHARRVCFVEGRLTFRGAPSVAPFPSALVYYGGDEDRFASVFRSLGWVVEGRR